jgi:hypothetical protein
MGIYTDYTGYLYPNSFPISSSISWIAGWFSANLTWSCGWIQTSVLLIDTDAPLVLLSPSRLCNATLANGSSCHSAIRRIGTHVELLDDELDRCKQLLLAEGHKEYIRSNSSIFSKLVKIDINVLNTNQ